jgi:hypothetical protein
LPSGRDRARVGVLQLRAALLELHDRTPDALEHVERLEAGDHDRDVEALDQRPVLGRAHHRADVPGGEEGVDPADRRGGDRGDRRRDQHVADQHGEVGDAPRLGLHDGHGVGGGGGLEADAEEHHLLVGVGLRDADRIERASRRPARPHRCCGS